MSPRPNVEDQRREEITEAALRCFARDGFAETSMDGIAREAGLSKALIYYYYKNKEDVFEAGFDAWMTRMVNLFLALESEGSAAERLRKLGTVMTDVYQEPAELFGLLLEYWALSKRRQAMLDRFREEFGAMRAVLARVLDEGVRADEFRPIDTQQVASVIFAAIDGIWAHWILDPEAMDLVNALQSLIDVLLEGLVKKT